MGKRNKPEVQMGAITASSLPNGKRFRLEAGKTRKPDASTYRILHYDGERKKFRVRNERCRSEFYIDVTELVFPIQ